MNRDPIVEEIHQTRRKIWEECNGDLDQFLDRLQAAEVRDRRRGVATMALPTKTHVVKSTESAIRKPICGGMNMPTNEVNAADFFNAESPTCGLEDAIASLPETGGGVRIPAGTYPLRKTLYVPSRVSLIGDGPATALTILPLQVAPLARDIHKGERVLTCTSKPPFRVGEGIGVCDDDHRGWWGTHGEVERVEGVRVWMNVPFERDLSASRNARAVNLFPGIWAEGETDIAIRDLTLKGPENYEGAWWDFTYSAMHIVACERVRILNCSVFGWPSDGFGIQRGCDVQVAHCQAHGCRGHGFHPGTGLARSIWSHNIGKGNGGDGYYFCARVHHSVCSDSVFSENGQHGIGGVANGGDHHNIASNNVCSHNGMCGIDANRGEEQVMTGNLLLGNSRAEPGKYPGIRVHDLTHSIIQGNRCADDREPQTQQKGIEESGASDYNLISGNLCAGMAQAIAIVGKHSRAEGNLV